jgi:hypothetical protein
VKAANGLAGTGDATAEVEAPGAVVAVAVEAFGVEAADANRMVVAKVEESQ